MSDHRADVEVAEQLEGEARDRLESGRGGDSLELAVDQLHADRANGEPLTTAIEGLRVALDEERDTGSGGAHA